MAPPYPPNSTLPLCFADLSTSNNPLSTSPVLCPWLPSNPHTLADSFRWFQKGWNSPPSFPILWAPDCWSLSIDFILKCLTLWEVILDLKLCFLWLWWLTPSVHPCLSGTGSSHSGSLTINAVGIAFIIDFCSSFSPPPVAVQSPPFDSSSSLLRAMSSRRDHLVIQNHPWCRGLMILQGLFFWESYHLFFCRILSSWQGRVQHPSRWGFTFCCYSIDLRFGKHPHSRSSRCRPHWHRISWWCPW